MHNLYGLPSRRFRPGIAAAPLPAVFPYPSTIVHPGSCMPVWPFATPADSAVITQRRILDGEAPICLVCHDADDGGWLFLDGTAPADEVREAALVEFAAVLALDPSVAELADLKPGWQARRAATGGPWRRSVQ